VKLAGKVALVTGAGRGIGRGIAELFAEEGADVAVNDIEITPEGAKTVVSAIESMGRRSIAVQADVSDRSAVEGMFDWVR
jgi:NAD(P)-dependent dehydrogenase (short-subunit alcohol dehydrogenase family)